MNTKRDQETVKDRWIDNQDPIRYVNVIWQYERVLSVWMSSHTVIRGAAHRSAFEVGCVRMCVSPRPGSQKNAVTAALRAHVRCLLFFFLAYVKLSFKKKIEKEIMRTMLLERHIRGIMYLLLFLAERPSHVWSLFYQIPSPCPVPQKELIDCTWHGLYGRIDSFI